MNERQGPDPTELIMPEDSTYADLQAASGVPNQEERKLFDEYQLAMKDKDEALAEERRTQLSKKGWNIVQSGYNREPFGGLRRMDRKQYLQDKIMTLSAAKGKPLTLEDLNNSSKVFNLSRIPTEIGVLADDLRMAISPTQNEEKYNPTVDSQGRSVEDLFPQEAVASEFTQTTVAGYNAAKTQADFVAADVLSTNDNHLRNRLAPFPAGSQRTSYDNWYNEGEVQGARQDALTRIANETKQSIRDKAVEEEREAEIIRLRETLTTVNTFVAAKLAYESLIEQYARNELLITPEQYKQLVEEYGQKLATLSN